MCTCDNINVKLFHSCISKKSSNTISNTNNNNNKSKNKNKTKKKNSNTDSWHAG